MPVCQAALGVPPSPCGTQWEYPMRNMQRAIVSALGLVMLCLPLRAQTEGGSATNVRPAGLGPVYSLDQFGPCATAAESEQTFQKASADILAAGGGVVVIPTAAAPGWVPQNNSQREWRKPAPPDPAKSWGAGPGITVVDARGGTVKISPPQTTGLEINRVLDLAEGESLPFWGYYPILSIKNTILHGATSYRDWLQADVEKGKDRRFYVKTIRGIFPGMFMSIGEWGVVQRLWVKSLGYDKEKQMWYFVADTEADQPKGAIMGNKNHVSSLNLETFSHDENQTFDVRLWRHNYSQGDNYLVDARFKYMSDVHSTAGDENGVIYAAFVESETAIFRGQVEKWNPATGELQFTGSSGSTLGSGRPIINLNPGKSITNGAVSLERNGRIRFSAAAPVTEAAVGRYFAVDEPDEYVPPAAGKVRRWFLIDSVTTNPDGTKEIQIVRHWWGAKSNLGAPKLYKAGNYSTGDPVKWLKYIIAPGANAYDVSAGVNNPHRLVKLVPTPVAGTPADFAPNDPIEQAIGPDPFKPIPFRSWVWDAVPGRFAAPIFDIANHGQVMRDYMLQVRGGTGDLAKDAAARYDQNPPWDQVVAVDAASNIGIKFGGDTANAAMIFVQPHGRVQPIKWFYGNGQEASLIVARDNGDFNFTGGNLRLSGSVVTTGLSADKEPARNLRGKNLAVTEGATSYAVEFPVAEADSNYAVFVEQTWLANRAITEQTAHGFTVTFDKPAPAKAKLHWMIVR